MDDDTERMTAELADELASNERRIIDPRGVPVRFSHLKAMAQSPAHCFNAFQESERRETLAIRIGSGVHAMLFDQPVVRWEGKVRNGKVWDAFKAAHAGAAILTRKEWARAEALASAIRRHDEASELLFGAGVIHERTIQWEQCGRARRSTPDVRGPHYVAELKTTRCAEPGRFVRDGLFRAYNAQIADQMLAVQHETGKWPGKGYVIAVESMPPYPVTVFELTPRALERGEQLCRLWLERLLVCEADNHWPAYRECIEMFDTPDDDVELIFGDDEEAAA